MFVWRRPFLLFVIILLSAGRADARVYATVQQALDSAFPSPARIERRTLYLDEAQTRRIAEESGGPVEARVIPYYIGRREGQVVGYAYFDTHLVRTLPETVLVLLAADGTLRRVEILSFDEPEDYLPSSRWLEQFPGRSLDDLKERRGIRTLTGATLSSRAVVQAARRIMALHRLLVAPPPAHP